MQKEFTEQWGQIYNAWIKPITDLNTRTLNSLTAKSDYVNDFMQAKRPEAFVDAYIKLVASTNVKANTYLQEAWNIWSEASSQLGKTFANTVNEATTQASDAVKSASNKFKDL